MPTTDDTQSAFRLLLTPDGPALAAGHATTLRVLTRIQAPEPPAETSRRRPLHLALVLDRSGSMSGVPLGKAKRCARHILDGLAPGDRAAIIASDDEVLPVAALTPATDKLALAGALVTITSGGSTNLHGGWRAGARGTTSDVAKCQPELGFTSTSRPGLVHMRRAAASRKARLST